MRRCARGHGFAVLCCVTSAFFHFSIFSFFVCSTLFIFSFFMFSFLLFFSQFFVERQTRYRQCPEEGHAHRGQLQSHWNRGYAVDFELNCEARSRLCHKVQGRDRQRRPLRPSSSFQSLSKPTAFLTSGILAVSCSSGSARNSTNGIFARL